MSFKKIIVIISIVLIIASIATSTYMLWPKCSDEQKIYATAFVNRATSNYWGMNTDKNYLAFGGTSIGSTLKRTMVINHKKDAQVNITIAGDIAPYVSIEPANISITANTNQEVHFYFKPLSNAHHGNYTGVVTYCFQDK